MYSMTLYYNKEAREVRTLVKGGPPHMRADVITVCLNEQHFCDLVDSARHLCTMSGAKLEAFMITPFELPTTIDTHAE